MKQTEVFTDPHAYVVSSRKWFTLLTVAKILNLKKVKHFLKNNKIFLCKYFFLNQIIIYFGEKRKEKNFKTYQYLVKSLFSRVEKNKSARKPERYSYIHFHTIGEKID